MVPHHRQAVEMAETALTRAENPQVRDLAEQIRAAQDPETTTLTGFLTAWGADVPTTGDPGTGGMDHSGHDPGDPNTMGGMMPSDQMDRMRDAAGAAFDAMFLQMMIVHHEGAVADSRRELAEGASPEARDLASRIVSTQTAEIQYMRQLLQAG